MLDIHPPHQAAHSWKDFFIHIATICIGLLIAIALEQAVEAIHRASERRELLQDIQAECETNIKTLAPDVTFYRQASIGKPTLRVPCGPLPQPGERLQ